MFHERPVTMHSLGLFGLPPAVEIVPGAGCTDRTNLQHRFGASQSPTHAALFHAILDDMAAGAFNYPPCNRLTLPQGFVIVHWVGGVLVVIANPRDVLACLAGQAALARHPPHACDHS